jgi:hypothetical protein
MSADSAAPQEPAPIAPNGVKAGFTPPETPANTGGIAPPGLPLLGTGLSLQDVVKAALTAARERAQAAAEPPSRARRRRTRAPIEATDYAAMMRRMLKAHGRRVADADVEDLAELMELQPILEEAIAYAITESRARHGRSWTDIARAAGTTKQAAYQRWGGRTTPGAET